MLVAEELESGIVTDACRLVPQVSFFPQFGKQLYGFRLFRVVLCPIYQGAPSIPEGPLLG